MCSLTIECVSNKHTCLPPCHHKQTHTHVRYMHARMFVFILYIFILYIFILYIFILSSTPDSEKCIFGHSIFGLQTTSHSPGPRFSVLELVCSERASRRRETRNKKQGNKAGTTRDRGQQTIRSSRYLGAPGRQRATPWLPLRVSPPCCRRRLVQDLGPGVCGVGPCWVWAQRQAGRGLERLARADKRAAGAAPLTGCGAGGAGVEPGLGWVTISPWSVGAARGC